MKKRILIFSLAYYPHVGGAEVALKEITDRIKDVEFHLITLRFADEPREERVGNVVVHRAPGGRSYLAKVLYAPRAALLARRLHRAQPFDAFWSMMSYMTFPIVLARFLGVRVPYLVTLQEGDPFEYVFSRTRIKLFKPLLSLGFKRASAVQTISTFLAAWAKGAGFPGTPVVVPNGVDIAHFTHTFSDAFIREKQRKIGKKEGDTFLVTTSRLVEKNAVDDVIRALSLLPNTVHFLVCGAGPDEATLKQLAEELGVEHRTHFMGHIDHADMPLALKACDIFIRPSRSEGMGNSFIEAMAAGLPVVATQEGGISDFLFDARRNPGTPATGWAVDKDSPDQIAAAVRDIMAHPEAVAQVTATAKQMALEKYDWNLIAKQMRGVFDQVFAKG